MKIAYNWLKQYLNTDKTPDELGAILTDIGLEVEGIETYESLQGGLEGLVVGHVLTCEPHENADKLNVTTVSIGGETPLQIVCGAPNVAAGQKVIVATVGATLYPTEGEPFEIKKSKIRGVESHGMICAEDEIGLGKGHAGIIVLPADTAVGTPAADVFGIERDTIFEIGLTPNRSDATSHLGVARDLAARLRIEYQESATVTPPAVAAFAAQALLPMQVTVADYAACPRYAGVVIDQLQVGPSPDWLRHRLESIGVKSINNVVDATNYVLHELGQPLHAFDYDAIVGQHVQVQQLPEGTPFTTLDEEERQLHAEDLMICDGNGTGMCIGGVFGGLHSGVKDNTTRIFLESAYFAPRPLRRTSTRHLLRTEAAKCFEKGVDPNGVVYALKRAALLIVELAGGRVASELIDLYPEPIAPATVTVRYHKVKSLIGADIPVDKIKAILAALNIEIATETAEGLTVRIPTDKHDVLREADVIEEILRIYGFNRVAFSDTLRSTLAYTEGIDKRQVQNQVADLLTAGGYYEMMSLSITQSKYFEEVLPQPAESLVFINNTANQGLDVMRPTLLFSGLEAIVRNQNRQYPDLKLYEFGKTYRRLAAGEYREEEQLALFVTGRRQPENWIDAPREADYYTLKGAVDQVMRKLGITSYQQTATSNEELAYALQYHRGQQVLVTFGRVQPSLLREMDIKQPVYSAVFQWSALLKAAEKASIHTTDLPKHPYVRRDLALIVEKSVTFEAIASIAHKQAKKLLQAVDLFDVYENEAHVGEGKKSYAVSFLLQDPDKTLQVKEVDKLMQKLVKSYEHQLGALIRK